jgi:hypothetical protein
MGHAWKLSAGLGAIVPPDAATLRDHGTRRYDNLPAMTR